MEACPAEVDLPTLSKELFKQIPKPLDAVGVVRKAYVGYSLNPEIRSQGSSGGVVTGLLLYMLRKRLIDQALVCGKHKDRPLQPNPIIAHTEKEIMESAQSKYTIVPQMRHLKELLESKKKTAVVGLPCHIHSFRKLASRQREIAKYVPVVIGLACHSTLEIEATQKLLEIAGIKEEEVIKFEYRYGNSWPGSIHVTLRNGEIRSFFPMNHQAAFNRLLLFYTPKRCLTCIDFSAELSDLTVLDPWIRDEKGQYPYKGKYSLILVRDSKAQELLGQAVSDRNLFLEEISLSTLTSIFSPMVKKKKIGASIRIENLKKRGKAYPNYNVRFPKPTLEEKIREKLDSLTRVCSKWEWSRDLGMRLAFSSLGNHLVKAKTAYKKCKFSLKYRLRRLQNRKLFFFKQNE
jgi:coenzyme F420 hydrogenase subunit beta